MGNMVDTYVCSIYFWWLFNVFVWFNTRRHNASGNFVSMKHPFEGNV